MYRQDWNNCDECDLMEQIHNTVINDSEALELIELGLEQLNENAFGLKRKKIVKLIRKIKKIKRS